MACRVFLTFQMFIVGFRSIIVNFYGTITRHAKGRTTDIRNHFRKSLPDYLEWLSQQYMTLIVSDN